jgi:NhaP-type Na+/H+ or K+/H+ antiporter
MAASVAMVAAFTCYVFDLPLGAGVLLGAIVAPTDPVLATDVQIRHPGDQDQLRFALTCEAGMNDGSAFPFVMLGLGLLGLDQVGATGLDWVLADVLWATLAGIAVGVLGGVALARLIWKIRGEHPGRELMDDFLGLGLIGVVYGISVLIDAWGFLAVFFAAVALHQTELKLAGRGNGRVAPVRVPPPGTSGAADAAAPAPAEVSAAEPPALVSESSLVFKEHLERLSEVVLILLVGGMLFIDSWSWLAVGFALFLFVVVRPLSVLLGMLGSGTSWRMRGLIGWFGVRGIGSLYYLMFAIQHGLPEALSLQFIQLTLVVIALSIVMHGASVKPLLSLFWRRRRPR